MSFSVDSHVKWNGHPYDSYYGNVGGKDSMSIYLQTFEMRFSRFTPGHA